MAGSLIEAVCEVEFLRKMSDCGDVMSLTDPASNEISFDESSMEERLDVGIVRLYANEPLAHKSNNHKVYAEIQHGLFPFVLRAQL